MNDTDLADRSCHEYAAGSPVLTPEVVQRYLPQVPGWELVEGKTLRLSRRCEDFMDAIGLVNKVAAIAEEQQHHPDLNIHSYRMLELDFSTHSIGGLSENDFIMAARVNRIL